MMTSGVGGKNGSHVEELAAWTSRVDAEIGSDEGLNDSWFTGFAPADDPQVALAVVFEDVDVATGASLTSPGAKRLFEAVLNK